MRTHIRRAAVAAVVVPLLAVSAACSGGADGGGPDDAGERGRTGARGADRSPGGEAPQDGPQGGAQNGAEGGTGADAGPNAGGGGGKESRTAPLDDGALRRALLRKGDVPGYEVRRGPADALPAEATLAADRPACQPIADALGSRPKYPRTGYVSASLTKGDLTRAPGGTLTQLLLAAYRSGDAQKWLADLRGAVAGCPGFTASDNEGDHQSLTITPGGNLAVGDASVSFLMRDKAGTDAPVSITVVRTGDNTATYLSVGTSGKPTPVARAVAYEQHRRIMDAGKLP
ncbi:sensor domain-containing protein [Streptomyces sp. 796.1]|uniref:sensor domain-containing protein n=1 Tax=Streptomyces sp. 796.1 TaxID=3163029 RepID=UPI0039C9F1D5